MPKKVIKDYELNQCALYKIVSKKRLSKVIGVAIKQLESYAKLGDANYHIFEIKPEGRKARTVEQPKQNIEKIHSRIFKLIQRIKPPCYLYSGVKGKSYIDNAIAHAGNHKVAKLDIKSFYPSTKSSQVYSFFNNTLECSPDVSWLLTSVTTCKGHVPTGSPLSQLLAFYSHVYMFDKIYALSVMHDIKMTCYVDDLTFSGATLTKRFLFEVKKIIHKRGLRYHKEHFYSADKAKLITGVIIDGDQCLVPNSLNKGIGELFRNIDNLDEEKMRSLVGKCNAASQIEDRFKSAAIAARRKLGKIKSVIRNH